MRGWLPYYILSFERLPKTWWISHSYRRNNSHSYRFLARQIVHVYVPAKCQSISRLKFILWVIAVSTCLTALFRCVCSLDLSGRVGGFWKTKHYMDCSSSRPSKSHDFRKQWSWLKFHTYQHIWHWRDRSFFVQNQHRAKHGCQTTNCRLLKMKNDRFTFHRERSAPKVPL